MSWTHWQKIIVAASLLSIAVSMGFLVYDARELLNQVEMGKMMPFIMVDPTTTTTIDPRK